MRSAFYSVPLFLGVAAIGWNGDKVNQEINPPRRQAGLQAAETHASASLLGQFRTSFSSWMWVRTDLYLHNGVEMRQMTESEAKSGLEASQAAEDGHERLHDESTATTVIPLAEHDFRGVFGDVERATKAFKDMRGHSHNDPKKAMPLFRLMTWVDPAFIEGWTTGSMILARDRDDMGTAMAIAFAEEGRRANPYSVDILTQLGYLQITRKRDLYGAVQLLEKAVQTGVSLKGKLPEPEREAHREAYRWLALCYRDLGRASDMHRILEEGRAAFPEDPLLQKLQRPAAMIFIPKSTEKPKPVEQPSNREVEEHDHHDHDHEHEHGHDHHDHSHAH